MSVQNDVLFSKNHGHSVPASFLNIAPSHVNDSNSHFSHVAIALLCARLRGERKIAEDKAWLQT